MTTEILPLPDFSRELCERGLPHTLFTALVWLFGGMWGLFVSKSQAIIIIHYTLIKKQLV